MNSDVHLKVSTVSSIDLAHTVKLNVGCGPVIARGWINVDYSLRARFRRYFPVVDRALTALGIIPSTEFNEQIVIFNLTRRWPLSNNSVDCIYAGEVLEHFTPEDANHFLDECFRVLKPGGILRVRVPDNYLFWKNYITEFESVRKCPPEEWNNNHTRWTSMFFRDICTKKRWIGSFGHYHKWAYDEVSLVLTIKSHGFVDVIRKPFLESLIKDIHEVEIRDNLIVEAIKPCR